MSAKHDLRPWYASLPLTSLILTAPFVFVALCGNKWSPTDSTFTTLAKPKEPPSVQIAESLHETLLTATSWLAYPPHHFARCDVQPGKHPRFAVCFDRHGTPILLRANVEQLVQIGLQVSAPVRGRWLLDGHRYLLGETLIETKPQLQIAPLPRPLADERLATPEQPQLVSLSRDEEFALWEDRRPRPDGAVQLLVSRVSDGRIESARTVNDPTQVARLRDPNVREELTQQIVFWTDQGRRQHVELPGDNQSEQEPREAAIEQNEASAE